jgi:hypothetical protein
MSEDKNELERLRRTNHLAMNVVQKATVDLNLLAEGLGLDAAQRVLMAMKVCQALFVKTVFTEIPVSMWQEYVLKWQGPMATGVAADLENLRSELAKGAQDGQP